MRIQGFAVLFAVCAWAIPAARAAQSVGRQLIAVDGGLSPLVAAGWADSFQRYFDSRTPDLRELERIFPCLNGLDPSDPATRASLEPVAQAIQAAAHRLLTPEIMEEQHLYTGYVEKLGVLSAHPLLRGLLDERQRKEIKETYRYCRSQLSRDKSNELNEKMILMIAALGASMRDASGMVSQAVPARVWRLTAAGKLRPIARPRVEGLASQGLAVTDPDRAWEGDLLEYAMPFLSLGTRKQGATELELLAAYLHAGDYVTARQMLLERTYNNLRKREGWILRLFSRRSPAEQFREHITKEFQGRKSSKVARELRDGARDVGISLSVARLLKYYSRVEALEEAGVISGYYARLMIGYVGNAARALGFDKRHRLFLKKYPNYFASDVYPYPVFLHPLGK